MIYILYNDKNLNTVKAMLQFDTEYVNGHNQLSKDLASVIYSYKALVLTRHASGSPGLF